MLKKSTCIYPTGNNGFMWEDNQFVIDIQVSYPGGLCQGYSIIQDDTG